MWLLPLLQLAVSLTVAVRGDDSGSYFITAPKTIQRGSRYDITVQISRAQDTVAVEAALINQVYNYFTRDYDFIILKNVSGDFNPGESGVLSMEIEPSIQCSSCRLNVRGKGGLQFERTMFPYFQYYVVAIVVQTDKAIYKPGQTVLFRVLAVYPSLKLYNGSFNIEITDPSKNKIQVWSDVLDSSGVFENSLTLSSQPVYGLWIISVTTTQTPDRYSKTFEVRDYVLQRFEIKVNLPPFGLVSDAALTGSVKATYTFGQPVKGSVEIHVGPNSGPDYCGRLPTTTQKGFKINGEVDFSFSRAEIQRSIYVYDGSQVKVTAIVTEENTGLRFNSSSVITYYSNRFSVLFLENTPANFKPGVPYQAYIQIKSPDGKPPTAPAQIRVYTYVSYTYTIPEQSFYGIYQFSGNYPLSSQVLDLPSSGVLAVDLYIPSNASSIYITVSSNLTQSRASKYVYKMSSPSNNYIQLSLLAKNVQSGTDVAIRVDGTEPLQVLTYLVQSRAVVAATGTIQVGGVTSLTFNLSVTAAMGPTAHLIVYSNRDNREIVADSLAFNVDGIFENKVSVAFTSNETEPHETAGVLVTAAQYSIVKLLAVDQSSLLLRGDNDITQSSIQNEVYKFDVGGRPTSSEFPLSGTYSNLRLIFENSNLNVITDFPLNEFQPPVNSPGPPEYEEAPSTPQANYPEMASTVGIPPAEPGAPPEAVPPNNPSPGSGLAEITRIRQLFPETWIWDSVVVNNSSGEVELEFQVPDSITSWCLSAFAVHEEKGLGIAPEMSKLQVSRPFFVSLDTTETLTRGEQSVIRATVFNNLPQDLQVVVTLKGSDSFRSVVVTVNDFNEKSETYVDGDQLKNITVKAGEQGVVCFPIQPVVFGGLSIEVSARSAVAADAELRPIFVEPEGVPVSFLYPFFIQLDGSSNYSDGIYYPLPDSAVPGSAEVSVRVTGDLIGPSLNNIQSLLRLPTGCGEQSLLSTASNLYIAFYLEATQQLTANTRKRIINVLQDGYQRQLTYQRYDGGFSAFGNNDGTSSTWLTAYAIRMLTLSSQFIYIEDNVLSRGLDWLVDRQNKDGSFNEFGTVLDRQMQGSGSSPELTAFVLLALLNWKEIAPPETCSVAKTNCYRVYRYGNATQKAVSNLENLVYSGRIQPNFPRAIVSFALAAANSSKALDSLNSLNEDSISEDGFQYWQQDTSSQGGSAYNPNSWSPPREQARSNDILTTAYASLAYTVLGLIEEGQSIIRWLVLQRNSNGGFSSSQDTVVALQALTAYATQSIRPDSSLSILLSAEEDSLQFNVDADNALDSQVQQLDSSATSASIDVSGQGFALVEIEQSFYVTKELTSPSFEVNAILLDDRLDSFNLMICSKWLRQTEVGMVIQQVSIPSGFKPDLSTLKSVAGLKRAEIRGRIVVVYFDQLSQASLCYTLLFSREGQVARSQAGYILTLNYYQPSERSTTFYLPRSLERATVCDVCPCCCPQSGTDADSSTETTSTDDFVVDPIYDYTEPETPNYTGIPGSPDQLSTTTSPIIPEPPDYPDEETSIPTLYTPPETSPTEYSEEQLYPDDTTSPPENLEDPSSYPETAIPPSTPVPEETTVLLGDPWWVFEPTETPPESENAPEPSSYPETDIPPSTPLPEETTVLVGDPWWVFEPTETPPESEIAPEQSTYYETSEPPSTPQLVEETPTIWGDPEWLWSTPYSETPPSPEETPPSPEETPELVPISETEAPIIEEDFDALGITTPAPAPSTEEPQPTSYLDTSVTPSGEIPVEESEPPIIVDDSGLAFVDTTVPTETPEEESETPVDDSGLAFIDTTLPSEFPEESETPVDDSGLAFVDTTLPTETPEEELETPVDDSGLAFIDTTLPRSEIPEEESETPVDDSGLAFVDTTLPTATPEEDSETPIIADDSGLVFLDTTQPIEPLSEEQPNTPPPSSITDTPELPALPQETSQPSTNPDTAVSPPYLNTTQPADNLETDQVISTQAPAILTRRRRQKMRLSKRKRSKRALKHLKF